jgi:hypothetical protein
MEPVAVSTKNGKIWIVQDVNGEDHGVVIDPHQAPLLVKWVEQAAEELLSENE